MLPMLILFFFFNDTATTEIYTLSLHDALPISWLNRIKGKHRQVSDMAEVNGGFGLAWSRIFYMTNNETGVPDSDITIVAVLRHNALPLAFTDSAWEKYKLGEVFHITDPKTKAPSVRNIFAHVQPDELPLPKMSVDELLASAVLFGACNMAIKFYSGIVSKAQNVPVDQVRQDWTAAVLPGIQIVPSGVWAGNRAPEHGCSYCFAG